VFWFGRRLGNGRLASGGRGVYGVVEAVATDLVRRGEHAGDDQPVGAERQWRQQPPGDLGRQRHRLAPAGPGEQVPVGVLHQDQLADQRGECVQLLIRGALPRVRELELEDPEPLQPVQQWHPHPPAVVGVLQLDLPEAPAGQRRLDAQRLRVAARVLRQRHQHVLLVVDQVHRHGPGAQRLPLVGQQRRDLVRHARAGRREQPGQHVLRRVAHLPHSRASLSQPVDACEAHDRAVTASCDGFPGTSDRPCSVATAEVAPTGRNAA
jgi:hypothetical protein